MKNLKRILNNKIALTMGVVAGLFFCSTVSAGPAEDLAVAVAAQAVADDQQVVLAAFQSLQAMLQQSQTDDQIAQEQAQQLVLTQAQTQLAQAQAVLAAAQAAQQAAQAQSPPVITSAGSVSGGEGWGFSYRITATQSPTSFGVTGTLPAGLALDTQTGVISGFPAMGGTSANVMMSAANSAGTGTAPLQITIVLSTPTIMSGYVYGSTVSGMVGAAFSLQIAANNRPTSFGVSGALPDGLSLNTQMGLISGTPTTAGTANVTLSASNAAGSGLWAVVIAINPAAPVMTSSGTVSGTVRTAFSYQMAATNNPTSFGVTGTLPAGLSLNAQTGVISGTPGTSGITALTMSARNAAGTGTTALQITIQAPAGNKLINVQGKITDAYGKPRTSPAQVIFRLYANLPDPTTNAVWSESQLVEPQNGLFNMALGNVTSLDTVPFNKPYYLGMQLSEDNSELQPRQLLGASAYALGSLGDFNVQGNEAVGGSVSAASVSISGQDVKSYLLPAGVIMMFAGTCPSGWTRFSALDNAFPMGSPTYGNTGGQATLTHSHSISVDGGHSHFLGSAGTAPYNCNGFQIGGGGTAAGYLFTPTIEGSGACTMQITTPGTNSAGSHSHSGSTGSTTLSTLPPYVTVVWCQKL